jgi:hypothetical protein
MTRAKESYRYNFGYSRVLGVLVTPGYDRTIPRSSKENPTRILFTAEHNPGDIFDNWRSSGLDSHQDYDARMGQINKVISGNKKLYFIQREGIGATSVNARAMQSDSSQGELILGSQLEILDPKASWVTDKYGTQHQRGVLATSDAVYGVDYNKRKIWRLQFSGKFELISDTKNIRKFMYEMIEPSTISDVTVQFPDEPVQNGGISVGYNKKFHQVIFSFVNPAPYTETQDKHTIRFSEQLDRFIGRSRIASPYYIDINEDFYSFEAAELPVGLVTPFALGSIMGVNLHDIDPTDTNFPGQVNYYGTQHRWYIKFVVAGPVNITKVFDALHINASENAITTIRYATQYQTAVHDVATNPDRYLIPLYKEGAWRIPVKRADGVTGTVDPDRIESRMRGKWLEVTVEYLPPHNTPIFVKSVVTKLRKSLNG